MIGHQEFAGLIYDLRGMIRNRETLVRTTAIEFIPPSADAADVVKARASEHGLQVEERTSEHGVVLVISGFPPEQLQYPADNGRCPTCHRDLQFPRI